MLLPAIFFLVAAASVEGLSIKPPVQCECPPLKPMTCKKGQRLDTFKADDVCGCKLQRCLWVVCPEPSHPKCGKCETLIEVDNCGCKDFQCVKVAPDHCPVKKVNCKDCEEIQQYKDDCGCQEDHCIPLPPPPSRCGNCSACEHCVEMSVMIKKCPMKEGVCQAKECPKMKEINCDFDCEFPEVQMDQCGCPKMICKKIPSDEKPPQCEECEVAHKILNKKCGTTHYECGKKKCPAAKKGKEICYEETKPDKCGCLTLRRKQCQLVPAGKCPPETAPMDGTDMCSCPHQICVPCDEMYEKAECKQCEIPVNVTAADGICTQTVCVRDPNCDICSALEALNKHRKCGKCQTLKSANVHVTEDQSCPIKICQNDNTLPGCNKCAKPVEPKCKKCQKIMTVKDANHCETKICVADNKPGCIQCPTFEPKKCPNKCQKPLITQAHGCKVSVCVHKAAKDCVAKKPVCKPCEELKVHKDECGCNVYSCGKKPCPPEDQIPDCPEGQTLTPAVSGCRCPTWDCVDPKEICKTTTPFPHKPTPAPHKPTPAQHKPTPANPVA